MEGLRDKRTAPRCTAFWPPDIYLFINAMQGLKSPLSNEDIRFFTQLDNSTRSTLPLTTFTSLVSYPIYEMTSTSPGVALIGWLKWNPCTNANRKWQI